MVTRVLLFKVLAMQMPAPTDGSGIWWTPLRDIELGTASTRDWPVGWCRHELPSSYISTTVHTDDVWVLPARQLLHRVERLTNWPGADMGNLLTWWTYSECMVQSFALFCAVRVLCKSETWVRLQEPCSYLGSGRSDLYIMCARCTGLVRTCC